MGSLHRPAARMLHRLYLSPQPRTLAGSLCNGVSRSFSSRSCGSDRGGLNPTLEGTDHPSWFLQDYEGVVSAFTSPTPELGGFRERAPLKPSSPAVLAPLSCGCMSHHHQHHHHLVGLGKRAMPAFPESIGSGSFSGSMILSHSYASSSRFEDKAKIRALMEARGLKKEPGWSRIEIQGQLNTFLVDDKSHPRNKEIRAELQRMLALMKDAGYCADLRCVLRDIPECEKENALQHHSERLAMALGHISLPPRSPMRVIKNLRVCNDCHVATKYFAYIYQREIIVRDATRFHHYRDGYCSCGDYW